MAGRAIIGIGATLALLLAALMGACTLARTDAKADGAGSAAAPAAGAAAAATAAMVEADAVADLYATDPTPLAPVQCGQCHKSPYQDLRRDGGRHRFSCQDCHEVIHAYSPVKDNYAALMPKCSQCHDQLHGEKQVDCLSCHNPHAPAKAPALARIEKVCADCHAQPARQLADFPSKHTVQGCTACHRDQHGYVPSCFECHQPHYPEQPLGECQTCHPVHQPLQIAFTPTTQAQICRDCHSEVVGKWAGSASKHGQVNCTLCHDQHGQAPSCAECHSAPHPQNQLAMFPRCLDCHLDVHDLPVKKKR
ncbi:MAG: cytochrome c3 family protein [Desulfuromonadales bacterium]